MALILKDRVKETSSSSGTGSITLGGAFPGYQTFNAAIASGSTVYYTIHNLTAGVDGEWEVGVGTFTSPATLSRDTVFSSSTGSKVNFTAGVSGLEVFITQPSEQAVYINDATGKVEVFGNGTNVVAFTEINTTNLTANTVTITAGTITTNAANNTDIVNKQYVDGIVSAGVHYHEPVLVESPTALNALYNQPGGAGNGVGATLTNNGANAALVIDGVTLSNTARVLVYQQSNAVQNGFYTVTNEGAPDTPGPGAKWVLTRATDADTYVVASSAGLSEGSTVFVQSGDTGAGEVYTCNTPGTIIFGTTNITFAQIGSAQIYSAGTGLSLNNTTFSISNTAVTAATYGDAGTVATFTVNAQGQLTNAANAAINASSITLGTLANARTTASDANGASTIVARDANGNFTANVITATTSNATTFNGTTGNFTNISGNGVALTAINASNVTSGTLVNARTTASDANSASTIVVRDANGAFAAGNVTAANFIGAGTTITSINASNISSGTIANARTTASSSNGASTIVQRDSGGNFAAATVTAAVIGDLSGGSNINASNIASGTIANARTTASSSNGASTIVLRDAGGAFAAGAITGTSFSGNGASLTAINASAITTGTLDNARTNATSANGASTLVVRDANGSFAGNVGTFVTVSGAHSGNGAGLTDINASNISSGTISNARTTAASANGASTIVARDANGSFTANVGTFTTVSGAHSGNGAGLTDINASNISSGTIANVRTTGASANGASTLVLRGTSGEFSAGAITGASFTGSGSGLTSIPNSATTAASANGASTIVARDANGSFTANVGTFTTVSGAGGGLSGINASNLASGTAPVARLAASGTPSASTFLRGDSSWTAVPSPNNGTLTMNTSGTGVSGSATFTADQAGASTFTVTSNANAANGASTIVARDASGNFTANVVTATNFSGGGGSISAINASNLSSGTVATARLASGTANSGTYLRGDQTWAAVSAGTLIPSGTVMLFAQTAAPTGFTKNTTTGDNSALRVTTGTASTGGSVAFTTAFASQTPSGTVSTTTGNTTATNIATTATNQNTTAGGSVTITAVAGSAGATTLSTPQIPSHSHGVPSGGNAGSVDRGYQFKSGGGTNQAAQTTDAAGGGGSHTHPFSFSSGSGSFTGTAHSHTQDAHNHTQNAHNHTASSTFTGNAINLAVQYIDVIRATKD
jgi:trimeric autotransporter adhesin